MQESRGAETTERAPSQESGSGSGQTAKEVRFEEPEAAPEAAPAAVPKPSLIPDAVYVLAQALLQNEAEARRRKAERYKNMLGL